MSLAIREMDDSPSLALPNFQHTIDQAQLLNEYQQHVQIATGQAVEKAMTYADSLSRNILEGLKAQIASIGKPKVMAVTINNGEVRKLKNPANKALGRMILNAKQGLHTLLVGPAGSGKTMAAEQLAEALNLPFYSVCFTAGASETWLFGRQTPNGFIEGPFPKAFRDGGVFLGDELDAADANMLLAINTALANRILYNPINGELIRQNTNFVFVAGANTVGMGANAVYTGRNRLDGATLTRFVKIEVNYDPEIEELVCPDDALRTKLQRAREVILKDKSGYVISTRCLDYAYRQRQMGVEVTDILKSLTMGWPEELISKCELDRWEEPKKRERKKVADQTGMENIF
jgi:cobaltochelatase CobS